MFMVGAAGGVNGSGSNGTVASRHGSLLAAGHACCCAHAALSPQLRSWQLTPHSQPLPHAPLALQLFRGPQAAGQPCAVTKYLGIAAVGTTSGTAFVLLPGTPGGGGGKQAATPLPPR